MKKIKLVLSVCTIASIAFVSCGGNEGKDEQSSKVVTDLKPKEFLFGDSKVSYTSEYSFSKNEKKSQTLKMASPFIIEAAYYDLKMPDIAGMAGVNCQKIKDNPAIDKMLDGVINGYSKIKGVKLENGKIENVSSEIGLTVKMATGNILFDDYKGGFTKGEYRVMVVEKGNEVFLFQGIFEKDGSVFAAGFKDMLNGIKIEPAAK